MPWLSLKLSYTRAFLGDLKTSDNLVLPPQIPDYDSGEEPQCGEMSQQK